MVAGSSGNCFQVEVEVEAELGKNYADLCRLLIVSLYCDCIESY